MHANPAAALLIVATLLPFAASGCRADSNGPSTGVPPLDQSLVSTFEPEARKQIEEAYREASRRPSEAERVGHMGMLLHAHGHPGAAVAFYGRASSQRPSDFRWKYYLGLAEKESGDLESAARSLAGAVKLMPDSLEARQNLATTLVDLERPDEAIPHLERILEEDPAAPLARYALGRAHSLKGDAHAALEEFQKACEASPSFGAAHYALALSYRHLGKEEEYRSHLAQFEKHSKNRPVSEDPLRTELAQLRLGSTAHFDRARELLEKGQFEEAVAEFQSTIRLRPDHPMANANLLGLYRLLGRHEDAHRLYRQAMQSNLEVAEIHYNYGLLLLDERQLEAAMDKFSRAVQINPSYADARVNLASLLSRKGETAQAVEQYRKALEIDSSQRLARYNLARILYFEKQDLSAALDLLTGALHPEDEKTPAIIALLANVSLEAGDLEKAETYGQRALELAARYEQKSLQRTVRYDLGRVFFLAGRYGETVDLLGPETEFRDERASQSIFLLASAHLRLGEENSAREEAGKALRLARQFNQVGLISRIEKVFGTQLGSSQ